MIMLTAGAAPPTAFGLTNHAYKDDEQTDWIVKKNSVDNTCLL